MASAFGRALRKGLRRVGNTVDTALHQSGKIHWFTTNGGLKILFVVVCSLLAGWTLSGETSAKSGIMLGLS